MLTTTATPTTTMATAKLKQTWKKNQPTTKSLNLIYNLKSEKWNGKIESETSIYTVSGMEKEVNRS